MERRVCMHVCCSDSIRRVSGAEIWVTRSVRLFLRDSIKYVVNENNTKQDLVSYELRSSERNFNNAWLSQRCLNLLTRAWIAVRMASWLLLRELSAGNLHFSVGEDISQRLGTFLRYFFLVSIASITSFVNDGVHGERSRDLTSCTGTTCHARREFFIPKYYLNFKYI